MKLSWMEVGLCTTYDVYIRCGLGETACWMVLGWVRLVAMTRDASCLGSKIPSEGGRAQLVDITLVWLVTNTIKKNHVQSMKRFFPMIEETRFWRVIRVGVWLFSVAAKEEEEQCPAPTTATRAHAKK